MDYVQTVLFQIAAAGVEEASRPKGLLAELEAHGAFLEEQPGFLGVRLTRSTAADGALTVVVETRWEDGGHLDSYQAQEPNVASILDKHGDLIVPDSLRAVDAEVAAEAAAGGPAAEPAASDARERLLLPLLVPLGIFLFGVVVIYGLSRIYLEVPKDVSTPLALGIAVAILLVSWYLASSARVPRWQVGGIVLLAAALLAGGGIYAAVNEEGGETATAVESPEAPVTPGPATPGAATPGPGATPAATAAPLPPGTVSIAMVSPLQFDKDELTVPAGEEVTLVFDNQETGIPHNWALYNDEAHTDPIVGRNEYICTAPCSEEISFGPLEAGTYFFRCDVHPQQMTGKLTAE